MNDRSRDRMPVRSIRFGVRQWDLIKREAEHEQVDASQFVRDAAFARALIASYRRGEIGWALFEAQVRSLEELGAEHTAALLDELARRQESERD